MVLLSSSNSALHLSLGQFAAECQTVEMKISTSKFEAMVLSRKRVDCPLQVGGELLPQIEEFKHLRVLFTIEREMEQEIDRQIGSNGDIEAVCCGEERAEPEGKAFNLQVVMRSG